ncbi:hypothetical protein ACSBR1_015286 [Camellia fascicularis]
MFLNVLAHHTKNRKIKFIFMRSGQTVSKHFNNVLKAVLHLHGLLLKKPEPITANCTDDSWSCFQNCLGALDGTYVKVLAPAIDKPRYRTRKGEIATNVLGVCSQDMQFIYVLPGWEGFASDSRVLRDAVSRPNGLKVPTEDSVTIFPHGEKGVPPTTPQEFFNMRHSSARNVIEKCFGLLKMRWAILRTYSYFPIKTQFRIITACCLLHNLVQREMPMDLDDDENEEMNPPPPATELGDEMIDVIEASDQWREWRTALATQMFNGKQAEDRATGELAEDSADAVAAMEKEDANATTEKGEQSPVEQFSMNMGDMDYSMSTVGNVPNRADSTKTGKKRARPAQGIPTELSEIAKNLGSFIENTNATMVEIAHRIGYSHDLSQ